MSHSSTKVNALTHLSINESKYGTLLQTKYEMLNMSISLENNGEYILPYASEKAF